MRKILPCVGATLLMLAFMNPSVFALVVTRIVLVSNTYGAPIAGQGTMVLDVESHETGAVGHNIETYENAFRLDATLDGQMVGTPAFSDQRFDGTNYTQTESYDDDRDVNYSYSFKGGGATYRSIPGPWVTIVRITIVYTITDATTSIIWTPDSPDPNPSPVYYVQVEGGSDRTGAEGVTPSDISLPVWMTDFAAVFARGAGVQLAWKTESEVNCEGFHVWRSDSANADYARITATLIQGHENSPTEHEYSYVDRSVVEGLVYWYKLEEVSAYGVSTFFGPISTEVQRMPSSLALFQNYPNPFNPVTEIKYELPQDATTQLRIYNLLGEEVRTLVNAEQSAGTHTAPWDGSDDQGRQLGSGVYFYKLVAGDETKIRKMVKVE